MVKLNFAVNIKTWCLKYTCNQYFIQKQGIFYMTGRDHHFRPIIVVNVGRILKMDIK
jgi:hypothetical protein